MKSAHKKIYDFVVEYILEHKYPPSIREICDGVGFKSTSTAHYHLQKMIAVGMLETDAAEGSPRAIRVPGLVIMRRDNGKMEL